MSALGWVVPSSSDKQTAPQGQPRAAHPGCRVGRCWCPGPRLPVGASSQVPPAGLSSVARSRLSQLRFCPCPFRRLCPLKMRFPGRPLGGLPGILRETTFQSPRLTWEILLPNKVRFIV